MSNIDTLIQSIKAASYDLYVSDGGPLIKSKASFYGHKWNILKIRTVLCRP